MKKILVLAAVMIASVATAQKLKETDVPQAVKSTFQKQYPKSKAKWAKEGNNYEAEFELNKTETSVVIDGSGNITETETEIAANQLPKEVTDFVNSNYKGQSIKEAAKITDAKGTVTFEAELKGKDLIFDSSGKFIKEVKN